MPAQEKIAEMDSEIRLKAVFGGYVFSVSQKCCKSPTYCHNTAGCVPVSRVSSKAVLLPIVDQLQHNCDLENRLLLVRCYLRDSSFVIRKELELQFYFANKGYVYENNFVV